MPAISVVIPVKNEAKKIRACIEGILSQTVPVSEIIVLDSGSTDDTLEILSEYDKVKVIDIPPSEFNHGATRNVGVHAATGEYIALTVGDAWAYNNEWIAELLKGFVAERVVAVCGQQVVAHDPKNNPVEWFRPYSTPQITTCSYSKEKFAQLSPEEKRRACSWDDVTAMYRADIIKNMPFRVTTYAEDAQWAKDALMAGHTLAYNPAARVYHYHLEDPDFSFKRNYTVLYHMYKFFGVVPTVPEININTHLSYIKALLKSKGISFFDKFKWWRYNVTAREGLIKAAKAVNAAIAKGEEYLDEEHKKYCGKPPIPKKD
ncbi:MAG: glycosyltransferase family 2 protein [Chitinophagales bacterium]|nr:glycosyltransferase family 2 protein [Chitinophagaceae bacterium]MCB9064631.1 glycosyltransferase family 2 protein [Chitinophagales bacterium]